MLSIGGNRALSPLIEEHRKKYYKYPKLTTLIDTVDF